MSNPAKQEPIKEPEISVIPEEHKPADVEVALDKQETLAPDPTEKLRNQMFYEMRQSEKKIMAAQKQMMEEMIQRMSGNSAQAPNRATEKLDEFDEEVEREAQLNWQRGVKKLVKKDIDSLVEEKLQERLKAQEEERKQETVRQNAMRVEAKGREKVLAEFPDIMDESTPEFKAYMEIYNREVNDDPMFMHNPRKHELILPELREKVGGRRVESNPEIERLKRVAAGASSPTRPATQSNSIMLTQEEIEMCKRSGIPVQAYARTKKQGASALKEGIVIDE